MPFFNQMINKCYQEQVNVGKSDILYMKSSSNYYIIQKCDTYLFALRNKQYIFIIRTYILHIF